MKPILLRIIILLQLWCSAFFVIRSRSQRRYSQLYDSSARDVARLIRPSVAMVVPVGVRNVTTRGSGFVVNFNETDNNAVHLLTAAHVAAPGHRLEVVFFPDATDVENNSTHVATVVGRNMGLDLALLKISNIQQPKDYLPLSLMGGSSPLDDIAATENQKERVVEDLVGTPCFAIGFPSGGVIGSAMTRGIVCAHASGKVFASNNDDDTKKTRFVVTDAAMAGGMSGGPLVNENGSVMGVNALVNMELRALGNYAVSSVECQSFLFKLSQRIKKSQTNNDEINDDTKTAYRVMLFNDRFNKRRHVSDILNRVAKLNRTQADAIMMEAHQLGSSTIQLFDSREDAKKLCNELQKTDLLVEVQEVDDCTL